MRGWGKIRWQLFSEESATPTPRTLSSRQAPWSRQSPPVPPTRARSRPVLPSQPIKGAGDGSNKSQKNVVNKKGLHDPERTAPPLSEPAC